MSDQLQKLQAHVMQQPWSEPMAKLRARVESVHENLRIYGSQLQRIESDLTGLVTDEEHGAILGRVAFVEGRLKQLENMPELPPLDERSGRNGAVVKGSPPAPVPPLEANPTGMP